MAKVPGIETILGAADLISDVRRAFSRIEALEKSQKDVADALLRLDARVRELEAGLREAKSDIKLEAVKEAQGIVNSVQSSLYSQLRDLSVEMKSLSENSKFTIDGHRRGNNNSLQKPDGD